MGSNPTPSARKLTNKLLFLLYYLSSAGLALLSSRQSAGQHGTDEDHVHRGHAERDAESPPILRPSTWKPLGLPRKPPTSFCRTSRRRRTMRAAKLPPPSNLAGPSPCLDNSSPVAMQTSRGCCSDQPRNGSSLPSLDRAAHGGCRRRVRILPSTHAFLCSCTIVQTGNVTLLWSGIK